MVLRSTQVISAVGSPGTREYSVISAVVVQVLASTVISAVGTPGTGEYSVISAVGTPGTREYSVISAFGTQGLASIQSFQRLVLQVVASTQVMSAVGVCCLLAFLMLIFFFSSRPSLFSTSIWTSFVASCLFLVGTRMLSPRFRFLLRLV